jgi:hypothetical protein
MDVTLDMSNKPDLKLSWAKIISDLKNKIIVASIMVTIIGSLEVTWSSIALFNQQVEAATSMGVPFNATNTKPVEGYDSPQGYFTVVKHIYNDPNLRVSVFCKPSVKVLVTCQVYDMSLSYPRLIGIQYAITPIEYNSLPPQEKPNWYILDKTLLTQTQPQFPELNAQQIHVVLPHLLGNYAKLIITWNPLDSLPVSANNHLRTENLQNLFVHNQIHTNSSSTSK